MPKKMRRLALSACSRLKASAGEILVVEHLELKEPKTKEIAQILKTLGQTLQALIVLLSLKSM